MQFGKEMFSISEHVNQRASKITTKQPKHAIHSVDIDNFFLAGKHSSFSPLHWLGTYIRNKLFVLLPFFAVVKAPLFQLQLDFSNNERLLDRVFSRSQRDCSVAISHKNTKFAT